jgi:hypothetical protein
MAVYWFTLAVLVYGVECQVDKSVLDFSKAIPDPQTGQLCVMQQVCIADLEALSRQSHVNKTS